MGLITLTSDFGAKDGYVAAMKGVILSICPEATLVDVTHDIPPQDVRHGAFVLHTVAPCFPPGTVHLAVVDPGVGTRRRAVAVQTARAIFVAPDNGLLSFALMGEADYTAVELSSPEYHRHPVSATFHGRDIFAPAAAHLCRGVPLTAFGPVAEALTLFPIPRPFYTDADILCGEVIHVDRFGNVVSNVRREDVLWPRVRAIHLRGRAIQRLCYTYGEAKPGELIALLGSSGYLEVAAREGSAADRLGAKVGDSVQVQFAEQA